MTGTPPISLSAYSQTTAVTESNEDYHKQTKANVCTVLGDVF